MKFNHEEFSCRKFDYHYKSRERPRSSLACTAAHSMPGVTFLETFLQHVLPPGIHNKRRYGFWGYNVRTENLTLIRAQLGVPPVVHEHVENNDDGDV